MKNLRSILACLAFLLLCSCATIPPEYRSLADNTRPTMAEVAGRIKDKRVIFIGEAHMSRSDHLVQHEVIRQLHQKSGKKVAVAMEMFTDKKNNVLGKWVSGAIGESEFSREYAAEWTVPFSYYRSIFLYAREKGIPLFGLNADKTFINHIARYGIRAAGTDVRQKLKFTACSEEPRYAAAMNRYEERTRTSHTAEMPYLCDAQRARDAAMAYNLATLLGKSEDTVIVLLGSAHAAKFAVPEMLLQHLSVSYAVLLPGSFRGLAGKDIGADMADYLWY